MEKWAGLGPWRSAEIGLPDLLVCPCCADCLGVAAEAISIYWEREAGGKRNAGDGEAEAFVRKVQESNAYTQPVGRSLGSAPLQQSGGEAGSIISSNMEVLTMVALFRPGCCSDRRPLLAEQRWIDTHLAASQEGRKNITQELSPSPYELYAAYIK